MIQQLLSEVKKVSFVIMLICGLLYLMSILILQAPSWKEAATAASFLHAFVYLPTFLFLCIYITLSASLHIYTTQKAPSTPIPAIITAVSLGILSLCLMIYLAFL